MMRRRFVSLVAVFVLVGGLSSIRADSTPYMNVAAYGVELCSQAMCGAATFAGVVYGQVGANPRAFGTFIVAVNHDPLPDPYMTAAITGGSFQFSVGRRRLSGIVTSGALYNNGDNTFLVHANLEITSGGSGTLVYDGLLNHNVFPPTVIGTVVTQ